MSETPTPQEIILAMVAWLHSAGPSRAHPSNMAARALGVPWLCISAAVMAKGQRTIRLRITPGQRITCAMHPDLGGPGQPAQHGRLSNKDSAKLAAYLVAIGHKAHP